MRIISAGLANTAVTAPAISWLIAQTIKALTDLAIHKKINLRRLFGSGGMPSSHTAYVVSLTTVVGKLEGVGSPLFAACLAFAMVVMYDAAGVRRAAGKQAKILNALMSTHFPGEAFNERLMELIGHKPLEVLVGAVFGIAMGAMLG